MSTFHLSALQTVNHAGKSRSLSNILSNKSLFFKGERTVNTMLCLFGICHYFDKKRKEEIFDVLLIPPFLFLFVGWKLECKKIHDPSKMIAEFFAAPNFQLDKKV